MLQKMFKVIWLKNRFPINVQVSNLSLEIRKLLRLQTSPMNSFVLFSVTLLTSLFVCFALWWKRVHYSENFVQQVKSIPGSIETWITIFEILTVHSVKKLQLLFSTHKSEIRKYILEFVILDIVKNVTVQHMLQT